MAARLVAGALTIVVLCSCGESQRPPTAPTATATTPVTTGPQLARLTVTADRERILSTESIQLTARATLADGTDVVPKPVWVVDNPAAAVVDATGLVKGVGAGNVLVVAALQGMTASVPLRVDADFRGVWTGTSVQIAATCVDPRRCSRSPAAVKITVTQSGSSATAIFEEGTSRAQLNGSVSTDGRLTLSGQFESTSSTFGGSHLMGWRTRIDAAGMMTGQYTIATAQDFAPYVSVQQLQNTTRGPTAPPRPTTPTTGGPPAPATLRYLTIGPELSTLVVGRNQTLFANGVFSDGTARSVTASWSIDSSQVATITEPGVVSARRPGTVIVTASAAGLSATRRFTAIHDVAGWWEGTAVIRSCVSRLARNCQGGSGGAPVGQTVGVRFHVDQQSQRIHGLVTMNLTPGTYETWIDGTISDDGTMNLAGEWRLEQGGYRQIRRIANWKTSIRDDGTMFGTFTAAADEDGSGDATLQINLELVTLRNTRVLPNRVR